MPGEVLYLRNVETGYYITPIPESIAVTDVYMGVEVDSESGLNIERIGVR